MSSKLTVSKTTVTAALKRLVILKRADTDATLEIQVLFCMTNKMFNETATGDFSKVIMWIDNRKI